MELSKEVGGDTVVEVSSRGLGQDALGLKQIAESSGVNIIAGCGYYKVAGHPPDMAKRSVEDVATNGTLYHTPERYRVQHALVAIKHNQTIDRSLRHILPNDQSHMRSSAEIETLFADCPEAVEATLEIAERCEFGLSSDLGYTLRSRAFMPEAHRNTHIEGTRLTVENAAYILAGHHSACPTKMLDQCLELFNIESATPMQTWGQGTRRIYENLSANLRDKICLNRPARKVYRQASCVVLEDNNGVRETFDVVVFA